MSYNLTVSRGVDVDPRELDWPVRQKRALVPFDLDSEGLPVNPVQPDLPAGRGDLWHWGEAVCADAAAFVTSAGQRWLLMVERGDGHGWAIPGGTLEGDESPLGAAVRELHEETGIRVIGDRLKTTGARYVPDPRAGRHAWMVTVPYAAYIDIGDDDLPVATGADDARRAEWLRADTFVQLRGEIHDRGGTMFASHVEILLKIVT